METCTNYKPRIYRRGESRPQAAQPSAEVWRAGEVAVPLLMGHAGDPARPFVMQRVALADVMAWCDLRLVALEGDE